MKREIKFRGLRTDGKGWVYGDLINTPEKKCRIIGFDGFYSDGIFDYKDFNYIILPETIGQFTGLKDKNGVDIYEGDNLKYYQPYSKKWKIHIVLWDEKFSCFGLFENNDEWCKESDWLKIQNLEVIGNIHEAN